MFFSCFKHISLIKATQYSAIYGGCFSLLPQEMALAWPARQLADFGGFAVDAIDVRYPQKAAVVVQQKVEAGYGFRCLLVPGNTLKLTVQNELQWTYLLFFGHQYDKKSINFSMDPPIYYSQHSKLSNNCITLSFAQPRPSMQVSQTAISTSYLLYLLFTCSHLYTITRQLYSIQMSYQAIEKIESALQQSLLEAYELFDSRGKGCIDANSLIDGMKVLGYQIDKRQVEQMIEYLDQSNKGVISKDAFLKLMTARLDYRDEPQELRGAFQYYDQLGKGAMRLADLERIAEELGEEKEECRVMLSEADKDEDGTLNWQEFMRVVKKTSYF